MTRVIYASLSTGNMTWTKLWDGKASEVQPHGAAYMYIAHKSKDHVGNRIENRSFIDYTSEVYLTLCGVLCF